MSLSRDIHFVTAEALPNRTAPTLMKCLGHVYDTYPPTWLQNKQSPRRHGIRVLPHLHRCQPPRNAKYRQRR
jgi:hypothetical protein